MIGTHDSMTYRSPRLWIYRLFSWLWKTQTKSIDEQIALGTRYLDIRVKRFKDKWIFAHGIVTFKGKPMTLSEIADMCDELNVRARLLLERGNEEDEILFTQECNETILDRCSISFIAIKKGWKVLKNEDPQIIDYTYVPFLSNKGLWYNLTHMEWSTIKKWAKKHNPPITEELIQSDIVHFMDRI